MNNKTASWWALLSGRNGLRSLALCGGVALYAVNINVITTLLPSIVKDIGGLELYSWATILFMVASIFSVSLSPSLISYVGLRASFLTAILFFLLGSVAIAFSTTIYFLLGARTIQGLGGGLLLGLSYSAVRVVFIEPLWGRATALISSMWGIAALAGPTVGGAFAQAGHWRLAFIAIIPIALVVAFLVLASLKTPEHSHRSPPLNTPVFKAFLLSWSVLSIAFSGLSQSFLLMALAVVIMATILYGIWRDDENRGVVPLLPHGAYNLKQPLGSLYAGIGLLSMAISSEIYIPYFLQTIHNMAPMNAAYMTALVPVGWAVGAVSMAGLHAVIANKLLVVGPVISALSLVALAVLLPWQGLSAELYALEIIGLPLFTSGLGVGMAWPHLLSRVFTCAPEGQENVAASAMITLQLYAIAVGATVAGIITALVGLGSGSIEHAQQGATALFFSFAVLPLLFVFISGPARLGLKAPELG